MAQHGAYTSVGPSSLNDLSLLPSTLRDANWCLFQTRSLPEDLSIAYTARGALQMSTYNTRETCYTVKKNQILLKL